MNLLDQALMTQAYREVAANPIKRMIAYRIREFLRMNHLEFSVSRVEEDPNSFIYGVYKTLVILGLTSREKAELASHQ